MRCRWCGVEVRYEKPDGKFLGGWVADDGWGTLCVAAPDHVHVSGAETTVEVR